MLSCHLLSLGLLSRPFRYVPYGDSAPVGVPSLSCDGRVPGAALDLTHWTNNKTPDSLYADTSTGIAQKIFTSSQQGNLTHCRDDSKQS